MLRLEQLQHVSIFIPDLNDLVSEHLRTRVKTQPSELVTLQNLKSHSLNVHVLFDHQFVDDLFIALLKGLQVL